MRPPAFRRPKRLTGRRTDRPFRVHQVAEPEAERHCFLLSGVANNYIYKTPPFFRPRELPERYEPRISKGRNCAIPNRVPGRLNWDRLKDHEFI